VRERESIRHGTSRFNEMKEKEKEKKNRGRGHGNEMRHFM
jgi:hypothetical protein